MIELPTASDGSQGIRCGPASFIEPVEGKFTLFPGSCRRQFLDLEILGTLLDLHRGMLERVEVKENSHCLPARLFPVDGLLDRGGNGSAIPRVTQPTRSNMKSHSESRFGSTVVRVSVA